MQAWSLALIALAWIGVLFAIAWSGDRWAAVGRSPAGCRSTRIRIPDGRRLVGAAVSVNRHAPVGLDHDESWRPGEVCGETTLVVDRAFGDDETHPSFLSALSPRGSQCGASPIRTLSATTLAML